MEGTLDAMDFVLAQELRMSLDDVRALPNPIYQQWLAFMTYKAEMIRLAAKDPNAKSS